LNELPVIRFDVLKRWSFGIIGTAGTSRVPVVPIVPMVSKVQIGKSRNDEVRKHDSTIVYSRA
jgi:hypothetical protein